MPTRLDSNTVATVTTAWRSLVSRAGTAAETKLMDWTDHEQDIGFLKNVDALTALLDPFLLSPGAYADLPLSAEEIFRQVSLVLGSVRLPPGSAPKKGAPAEPGYFGFSASPYPYVDVPGVDYVDSAAAVLNLACATVDAAAIWKNRDTAGAGEAARGAAMAAVAFLLAARVDDRAGVRWLGIRPTTEGHAKYANLFFTRAASLALHRVLRNRELSALLAPAQVEEIHDVLPATCKWVMGQFEPTRHLFWMDVSRAMGQPIATLYALEVMYTLMEDLEDSAWGADCRRAIGSIVARMQTVKDAAALQMDVFHTLPLPGLAGGTVSYDDRGYIGSFLALFALAKSVDKENITDQFIRAGEELYRGVSDEWIDETSGMWDDGRPLICYTRDALIALVRHAQEGIVPRLLLREDEIRAAVREALGSSDVLDVMSAAVLERARRREETGPFVAPLEQLQLP